MFFSCSKKPYCSAVAVGSGSVSINMDVEFERELQYGCSVDSGSISSNTDARFEQSWWAIVLDINNAEGDVADLEQYSVGCIARAHSSLRGSVDLG